MTPRAPIALCAAAALLGCQPGPFDDEEHARLWLSVSAPSLFLYVYTPLAVAEAWIDYTDAACPTRVDDGTTLTVTGGCETTDTGTLYVGTATVTRDPGGGRTLVLDGYGTDDTAAAGNSVVTSGTFSATPDGTAWNYVMDLDVDSSVNDPTLGRATYRRVIQYAGRVDGWFDSPTTWDGAGTVEQTAGGDDPVLADVETIGESIDYNLCMSEALSGITYVRAAEDTLQVAYNGGVGCDPLATTHWFLNGEDMGEIADVSCTIRRMDSSAGRTTSATAVPLAVMAMALLALRTRRR